MPEILYVAVTFDKMKIKSCLNKEYREIVGFTDLGDPELTFSSFNNELPVTTTVIAFLVRALELQGCRSLMLHFYNWSQLFLKCIYSNTCNFPSPKITNIHIV